MRNKLLCYLTFSLLIFYGSSWAQKQDANNKGVKSMPYETISLDNLSAFEKTGRNWGVASSVSIDRTKKGSIFQEKGTGILVNTNDQKKNKHLTTNFEHGDIEIELDVMMPVGSNSGIYFQGRYEIQLLDSWGVKVPTYSDIGSVYQRWDEGRGKGNQGYEGTAASVNASKAPGLWQHLKIIFHAPKFDFEGNKTKNAWFEEVTLNGVQVVENSEVTGPTRGASFGKNEKALGPIVIQGNHGPVAFKNIKYKLYNTENQLKINNINAKIYESTDPLKNLKALSELKLIDEKVVKSISPLSDLEKNAKKLIVYTGTLVVTETSNYLFEMKALGGGFLAIRDNTIINMTKNNMDSSSFELLELKKGEVPITIVFNQIGRRNERGFELFVEGNHMQHQSLQVKDISEEEQAMIDMRFILIEQPNDKVVTQRSFLMHQDVKRTHCISVGFPQEINYSYDLETGSLLQVWNGGFLNATHMWHSRGQEQLCYPEGAVISFHGDEDFAYLKNETSPWPKEVYKTETLLEKGYVLESKLIQKGYKVDAQKNPLFLSELDGVAITNKFTPSDSERKLNRQITIDSKTEIWHKLTEGIKIELSNDGTYVIDDHNYYIDFSGNGTLTPVVRSKNGVDELLVKIPVGKRTINYSIIW